LFDPFGFLIARTTSLVLISVWFTYDGRRIKLVKSDVIPMTTALMNMKCAELLTLQRLVLQHELQRCSFVRSPREVHSNMSELVNELLAKDD